MLFLELVVNCRRTSELRSCMKMRSCGSADLLSCGPAYLRSCGPTYLRSCGPADLRSSIRQKIKVLNFENGFWVLLRWGCRSFFVYAPCLFLMIYALFIANYFRKLALLLFLQSEISWHLCWISSLIVAWDEELVLLHVSNLCILDFCLLSTFVDSFPTRNLSSVLLSNGVNCSDFRTTGQKLWPRQVKMPFLP